MNRLKLRSELKQIAREFLLYVDKTNEERQRFCHDYNENVKPGDLANGPMIPMTIEPDWREFLIWLADGGANEK